MGPRHRLGIEALAVVVVAVLVLGLVRVVEGPDPPLRSDQVAINLMVVKALHPDWFQGDLLYGPDYSRHYIPSFVGLQAALARFWGDDPVAALRALFAPIGFLFLIGHYALFRSLTGRPWAAGLGALSAMTVRNALGGEYWGFSGIGSVQPRVIAEGLTPLLILAFLRWRTHRLFPVFYLLVGGMANLHPVSGFHLAQVTALAYLWVARFRWRAWRQVVAGVGLFVLGALPFLLRFLPGKDNLSDPTLLPTVRAALDYRFDYLFFPQRLDALLSVAFHVALPVALLLWLRRRCDGDLRLLGLLGALALFTGVVGTGLIQLLGVFADRPYIDINQLRAAKLMYIPLLATFPLIFGELLSRQGARSRAALVLLFVASVVPPGAIIHSVAEGQRDAVKRVLGIPVKGTSPGKGGTVESARAEAALWRWAVQHTDRNDLFLSDSLDFRANTLRPITGAHKDGAYLVFAGTAPLYRWYGYMREVEGCRARKGAGCWFPLAVKYRARYVVVDPGVDQATPEGGFVKVWFQSGWSLWRRTEES